MELGIKQLIDSSEIPILVMDINTKIVYANNHINELLKIEVLHKYFSEIGSLQDLQLLFKKKNNNNLPCEIAINTDKSEQQKFECKIDKININATTYYFLYLCRPALSPIHISEYYNFFIKNAMPMAITEYETGIFVDCNEQFLELAQLQKNEILEKTSIELGIFSDKEREKLIRKIDQKNPLFDYEIKVKTDNVNITGLISAKTFTIKKKKYITISITDISRQKKIEKQLYDNKELYRDIVESMPAMIIELDPNGEIEYANKRALQKFGYSTKDLYNRLYITELFDKKEHNRIGNNIEKFEFEDPEEYIAKRNDGKTFDSLVYSTRIINNNEYIGIRSVILDITKLKNYQRELTNSEHRLELALKGANQGLWDWNIKTGEFFFNERWQAMLGLEPGEIKIHISKLGKLLHPDDVPFIKKTLNKHMNGNTALFKTEHRILTQQGNWKWILNTGKIIEYDENGKPSRAAGTYVDIDYIKNTEINLKRNLKKQEILSELAIKNNSIKDFTIKINFILSNIGNHTKVSRAYIYEKNKTKSAVSNTFEWCNEETISHIAEFKDIPYSIIAPWIETLEKEGQLIFDHVEELSFLLKDIFIHQHIKSHISFPIFVKGVFHGFIGFNQCDKHRKWTKSEIEFFRTVSGIITNTFERNIIEKSYIKAKEEADIANISKSEFLANMSHEIRTPLNAILGISEALLSTATDAFVKSKIGTILSSGNTLLALINDILDLSKIESGKLDLKYQSVNLKKTIEEIITLFENKADEKGLSLKFEYNSNGYEIFKLDEIRIRQVLFNLIGNAIKFTELGEISVTVTINKTTNSLCSITTSVSDTGVGIAQDQQCIIFDSFKQQSGQDNKKYGGTGLGLAISKKLVDLMNGKISLESKQGIGSKFSIFLPGVKIVNCEQKEIKTKEDIFTTVDFKPSTILVVDDIKINVETITLLNKSEKLQFIGKYSGTEAMEWLNENTPDLILLDIKMPKPDGWETLKMIRKNPQLANIPVIAYTASGMKEEVEMATSTFNGMLIKPVTKQSLFKIIAKFISYKEKSNNVKETEQSQLKYSTELKTRVRILIETNELQSLDFINIEVIRNFAQELYKLAIENDNADLERISQTLLSHCHSFNVDGIEKYMRIITTIFHKNHD